MTTAPHWSVPATARAIATDRPALPTSGWLVHPVYDLLLIANVLWPLVIWLGATDGIARREGLLLWQVYFITTPHRWVTLLLVFGDRERFRSRYGLFVGIAIAVVAVTLGVRVGTGSLTCLLTIDYLWNAWHFSAQHHGVARLYSRHSAGQPSEPRWEKWAFRLFLLYVIFRVAGTTWAMETLDRALARCDFVVIAIPVVLLVRAARAGFAGSVGGFVYRASVCGMFLGMLWAVHEQQPEWVLAFATASAVFHASEYLAVVGWSLHRKRGTDTSALGLLGWVIPRWGLLMAIFVMTLGVAGYWFDQHWLEAWLTVNVAVAFLHYAYDGVIWRRPRGGSPA